MEAENRSLATRPGPALVTLGTRRSPTIRLGGARYSPQHNVIDMSDALMSSIDSSNDQLPITEDVGSVPGAKLDLGPDVLVKLEEVRRVVLLLQC